MDISLILFYFFCHQVKSVFFVRITGMQATNVSYAVTLMQCSLLWVDNFLQGHGFNTEMNSMARNWEILFVIRKFENIFMIFGNKICLFSLMPEQRQISFILVMTYLKSFVKNSKLLNQINIYNLYIQFFRL